MWYNAGIGPWGKAKLVQFKEKSDHLAFLRAAKIAKKNDAELILIWKSKSKLRISSHKRVSRHNSKLIWHRHSTPGETNLYGVYSNQQRQFRSAWRNDPCAFLYSTPDGREVIVTEVDRIPHVPSCAWPDKVSIGYVKKLIRQIF